MACINKECMLFCFLGSLNVTFVHDAGAPTAGQSLNLTCTAILNGIIGSPTIQWLDSNSNPISNNSNFTVKNMIMVNNSAYEATLVFSSVHTSHAGQYTCRAVLGKVSAMASTQLSVESMYIHTCTMHTWFCFIHLTFTSLQK